MNMQKTSKFEVLAFYYAITTYTFSLISECVKNI